jgi:hypothetical protein
MANHDEPSIAERRDVDLRLGDERGMAHVVLRGGAECTANVLAPMNVWRASTWVTWPHAANAA